MVGDVGTAPTPWTSKDLGLLLSQSPIFLVMLLKLLCISIKEGDNLISCITIHTPKKGTTNYDLTKNNVSI